jgi:hypothetical protein
MDQKSIMLDLDANQLLPQAIHKHFIAAIGHEVMICSIVIKYLRNISYCLWADGTNDNQEDQVLVKPMKNS